jgi:hypothetical protein
LNRIVVYTFIVALCLLAPFPVNAAAPDTDRIATTLETLRQSVNTHDFSRLEPALAADFSYQGRDAILSQVIMQQVIAGYPHEILAISILSISKDSENWNVAVRLESPDQVEQRNILFSRDYQIRQADIADIQLSGHGQQELPPIPDIDTDKLPAVTSIPFVLADRIIVVQAEINGVAGNYLVDSGAPVVMLNQIHFAPGVLSTMDLDHEPPTGVGGAMHEIRAARDLELNWGSISMNGLRGLVADLSHLEKNLDIPIMGLIGYEVLENFQVLFNYADRSLTLYSLDEYNQPLQESGLGKPELVAFFEKMKHLPVLPVRIGGLDLKLGIDSGAAGAMLFEKWQEPLRGQYEFLERSEMKGADTNVQMGDVVRIDSMQLKGLSYPNMTFRFNDIAGHGARIPPIDGLLGYEFLQARPTAINFRAQQVSIWPKSDRGEFLPGS